MLGRAGRRASARTRGGLTGSRNPGEASSSLGRGNRVGPGKAEELVGPVRIGRSRAARTGVRGPAGGSAGRLGGVGTPPAPAGRAAHRPPPAARSGVARVELR